MAVSKDGEMQVISANYTYTQTYTKVGSMTVAEAIDTFYEALEEEDCFTEIFILKEGDYPLRLSAQWAWVRRLQPSTVIQILRPELTKGEYARSESVSGQDGEKPLDTKAPN